MSVIATTHQPLIPVIVAPNQAIQSRAKPILTDLTAPCAAKYTLSQPWYIRHCVPYQAAKRKLEAARAEAAQLTGRLGEAEAEAKKHALLLQHIHVSAATDPTRLLTKCVCVSPSSLK